MKIGRGDISVRDTNIAARCRVCFNDIVKEDVMGSFLVNNETMNFHRHCMKSWLEYTFDVFAPTPGEIAADPNARQANRIEAGRMAREYEEYRAKLIEKLKSA